MQTIRPVGSVTHRRNFVSYLAQHGSGPRPYGSFFSTVAVLGDFQLLLQLMGRELQPHVPPGLVVGHHPVVDEEGYSHAARSVALRAVPVWWRFPPFSSAMGGLQVPPLWPTVMYEKVYLRAYPSVLEAQRGLQACFRFYNGLGPDQALDNRTPAEVFNREQDVVEVGV